MAIGPAIFIDRYKNLSIEELNNKLKELKIYRESEELEKAIEEELKRGVNDNSCTSNVVN